MSSSAHEACCGSNKHTYTCTNSTTRPYAVKSTPTAAIHTTPSSWAVLTAAPTFSKWTSVEAAPFAGGAASVTHRFLAPLSLLSPL